MFMFISIIIIIISIIIIIIRNTISIAIIVASTLRCCVRAHSWPAEQNIIPWIQNNIRSAQVRAYDDRA